MLLLQKWLEDRRNAKYKRTPPLTQRATRLLNLFMKSNRMRSRRSLMKELGITVCQFNNYVNQMRKRGYTILIYDSRGRRNLYYKLER